MKEPSASKIANQVSQVTNDFDSLTEKLSVRAQRVLANLNVKNSDGLLSLTRDDLICAWSCGKKTAAEIESLQIRLRSQYEQEDCQTPRTSIELGDQKVRYLGLKRLSLKRKFQEIIKFAWPEPNLKF